MVDPVSALTIISLAVTPFLNTEAGKASVGKIAEKLTEGTLKKMGELWALVHKKLCSKKLPEVDIAVRKAQQGDQSAINNVAKYLEQVMGTDNDFATEVQKLTQEIQQEITIQQGAGSKVYNVFGGKVEENTFTENKAPIIKDNNGTITINWGIPPSH
ncbi:MAG: hypothetical protein HC780_00520 [Leptolyngbyaceae cyanobacterium CSU_1_3]|nr:hypothetical protein [Leptolyngbyaceae cyanobacterium CSU_1_3]